MENKRKYDLEERLVDFAVRICDVVEALPDTKAGNYLGGQLIRSGMSPALNYGEALSAESRKDFIHKLKILLKELRESFTSLKIIKKKKMITEQRLEFIVKECNELISIFVKSISTTQKNIAKGQ